MKKLDILKNELNEMVISDTSYEELLKKSRELDYYITKEMKKINKIGKRKTKILKIF